jgi:hypothetical protein
MVSRIAGRMVTGPAAFFVAWVIEVGAFALSGFRQRLDRR